MSRLSPRRYGRAMHRARRKQRARILAPILLPKLIAGFMRAAFDAQREMMAALGVPAEVLGPGSPRGRYIEMAHFFGPARPMYDGPIATEPDPFSSVKLVKRYVPVVDLT